MAQLLIIGVVNTLNIFCIFDYQNLNMKNKTFWDVSVQSGSTDRKKNARSI